MVADPAEAAARFARLVGVAATAASDGVVLALPQGRVRFTAGAAFPGVAAPPCPSSPG